MRTTTHVVQWFQCKMTKTPIFRSGFCIERPSIAPADRSSRGGGAKLNVEVQPTRREVEAEVEVHPRRPILAFRNRSRSRHFSSPPKETEQNPCCWPIPRCDFVQHDRDTHGFVQRYSTKWPKITWFAASNILLFYPLPPKSKLKLKCN